MGSLAAQSQVYMLVQKSGHGNPVSVGCMAHGLRVFQQLVAHVIRTTHYVIQHITCMLGIHYLNRTYVTLHCDTCNHAILILHSLLVKADMILEYQACIALHDACRFCKKHLPAAVYIWPLSVMPTQSSLTTYCKLKAYRYSMTHKSDLFSRMLQPANLVAAHACWHYLAALH